MSQDPLPLWPPIINSDSISIWIRVRDIALTIGAWLIIVFTIHNLLWLLVDYFSDPIFALTTQNAADWHEIWDRFDGYVYIALGLIAWISLLAASRRKTINNTKYIKPASQSEEIIELEIELGVSHEDVEHWHELRSVNVYVNERNQISKISNSRA